MSIRCRRFSVLLLICAAIVPGLRAAAQEGDHGDMAREPFIFEQYHTVWRFENDGTGTRQVVARIRVQSEAGVQRLGQLVLGYSSSSEAMDINYVKVLRKDGSAIAATPDAAQDLPAPLVREAPMYSDFREKHITVPGLSAGETLEYSVTTRLLKALVPDQFYMEHQFEKGSMVLDETLEVNVPRERELRLKTGKGFDPKISTEGDRRVYRWSTSHLERAADEEPAKKRKSRSKPIIPDVQLTTLRSWEELGRWYAGLEKDRVTPTPEVRAKAEELTRNAKSDLEKIQILYSYVALNFRYISLSFGVGRYQPHAAGDILQHQYGDCKDKHTLLASLLASVGIAADAALISSRRSLDPDVPSPSQFDHMITAIPQGDSYLWLDTTTEVGPFRLLAPVLRARKALVVAPEGKARLVETPYDSPLPNTQQVEIEGKVSDLGKLQAHVRFTSRGDSELMFRSMFRRMGPAQWKAVVQALDGFYGLGGEVNNVSTSNIGLTQEPFRFEYDLTQPDYLDWSSRKSQLAMLLPAVTLKEVEPDADSGRLQLDPPLEFTARLRLELPASYTARAAVPIDLTRDYGEYHSTYRVERHVLTAERRYVTKEPDLPSSRADDYRAFVRALRADGEQKFSLENTVVGTPTIPASAKADELYDAGEAALKDQNFSAAADLFHRVLELEPKHKTAWIQLGRADFGMSRMEDAIAAFQKQIELNPYDETAYSSLGFVYWRQQRYDRAAESFHKQLEINPLDHYAHASLGMMFCEMKKYADALPELEKAISLKPDNAFYQVYLGQAYLNLDQPDQALAAFDTAVETAPSPTMWNNIAYELSQRKVKLDRAQQYAESAIASTEATLRNVSLARLRVEDLGLVNALAAYWDTLGWVHYQRGELDPAEKYIHAAWLLGQHSDVADHLAQIYEKRGQRDKAVETYAMALAASRPQPDTRAHMTALLGGDKKISGLVERYRPQLQAQRTIPMGALLKSKDKAEAEFFVLLSPGPRVDGVKFVRGSEELKPLVTALEAAKYPAEFPGSAPTRMVRRGVLSCQAGQCDFVLVLPEDVHGVN